MGVDFVMTLEDPEDGASDLVESYSTKYKEPKAELDLKKTKSEKKLKVAFNKRNQVTLESQSITSKEEPEPEVDTFNPDFTFDVEGGGALLGSKHPWDFSAARAALRPNNSVRVSIDEIIAKKRSSRADFKKLQTAEKPLISIKQANGSASSSKQKHNDDASQSSSDSDQTYSYSDHDEGSSFDSGKGENEKSFNQEISFDQDDEDIAADGFGGGVKDDSYEEEITNSEDAESVEEQEDDPDEYKYIYQDDTSTQDDDADQRERKKAYFADQSEIGLGTIADSFQSMNLSRPILKGLSQVGFVQPTPIQVQTIPIALMGRDICGGAITGSGKTAAFIVPILERLLYRPRQTPAVRVLILAPTRELAIQCHSVGMRLASFTDTTFCLCVGGLSLKVQEIELRQRPDIVIATPGRLIDHVRNSPSFTLDTIEILVVDEADRMLEDGFASELNEIIKNCPKSRQTLLFSATMTDNVDELIRLSLNRPVRLMVDPAKAFAARLTQEFVRIRKNHEEDRKAILLALCYRNFKNKTIIFLRSKALAHEMKIIFGLIGLKAAELHGNLSQEQRLEALEGFRDGNVDFLLATDLASRGLDIKGIQTVINYDMPQSYAHYLHRVGRTARAGRNGRSVTFSGESDRKILKTIIKHSLKEQIKRRIVPTDVIFKFRRKIVEIRDQVNEVLAEEKKGKEIRQVEIELAKSENLLKHEQEIYSRPARTWFQTEKEKQQAKEILGGKYVGQDQNGKKRKRTGAGEEKSASLKPKMTHGKFAGLPRAKKRRLQLQEQEQLDSANKIATIKSIKLAKKELKPTRITQLPSGQKLGNNKKTKPKSKDKQRAQVRFDMDLADVSKKSASAVIKKPRSAKKNPAKSSAKKGIINETRYKSSSRKRGIKKFGSKGNNRSTKFSGGSKKSRK